MNIIVEVLVRSSPAKVWNAWVSPENIVQWNHASEDWRCPRAEIDLSPGGKFSYRMEAVDGSMGFDLSGEFLEVVEQERVRYKLDDDRAVLVEFSQTSEGVLVRESFEAEQVHTPELQRQGWQSILDNFKNHVEGG